MRLQGRKICANVHISPLNHMASHENVFHLSCCLEKNLSILSGLKNLNHPHASQKASSKQLSFHSPWLFQAYERIGRKMRIYGNIVLIMQKVCDFGFKKPSANHVTHAVLMNPLSPCNAAHNTAHMQYIHTILYT